MWAPFLKKTPDRALHMAPGSLSWAVSSETGREWGPGLPGGGMAARGPSPSMWQSASSDCGPPQGAEGRQGFGLVTQRMLGQSK